MTERDTSGLGQLSALAAASAQMAAEPDNTTSSVPDADNGTRASRKRKLTTKALEQQHQKRASKRGSSRSQTVTRSGRTVRRSRRRVDAEAAKKNENRDSDSAGSTEAEDDEKDIKTNRKATKKRGNIGTTKYARQKDRERATLETLFSALEKEPEGRVDRTRIRRGNSGKKKRKRRRAQPATNNEDAAKSEFVNETSNIDNSRVKMRMRAVIGENSTRAIVPSPTNEEALRQLTVALRSKKFRSWCRSEFLMSAIDRLYFAQNDFVECLYEHGLGNITKVSRPEWSYIRSIIGKPRRMSPAFFREELKKLNRYREDVRCIQQGLTIVCEQFPFPEEIPARLVDGQTVIATHPSTGELHTGKVLTKPSQSRGTSRSKDAHAYFIQFDQEGLKDALVPDTAVMPYGELHSSLSHLQHPVGPRFPHANGDAHMVANLLRLLDRKEALLTHLRTMNNLVEELQKEQQSISAPSTAANEEFIEEIKTQNDLNNTYDAAPKVPDTFKQQCAWVIVELEKASKDLDDALQALRLRQSGISLGEAGSDLSVHVSQLCYQRARELMESIRDSMISTGKLTSKSSSAMPSKMNNLIVCCISLVLLIKFCAERGLQPLGLDAFLESVRPTHPQNRELFKKIERSVRQMQSMLSAA